MQLNPGNAFAKRIYLETPDVNGDPQPLTAGVVKAFWGATEDAVAAIAPALEVNLVHIGVADSNSKPLGTWLILFGADVLTRANLDASYLALKKAHLFVSSANKIFARATMPYVTREMRMLG